jgi:cation diffusion facilitator family transporter
VVVNIVLAAVKLFTGIQGNSFALIADAVESITDVVGSALIWGGLRISDKPADEEHPYGHGKAAAIAALIVACLIVFAGVGIALVSVRDITAPHHAPAAFTLITLAAVLGTKEALFRIVRRIAQRTGSGAVLVDAWHHRADAITSVAAFIGISVALIGGPGFERADAIAAIFASGVVSYNGARLMVVPLQELMDAQPRGVLGPAGAAAMMVPGVRRVEKARARQSGTRFWLDMHIEVNPDMTVRDAHVVAGKVKGAIRGAIPSVADVLVHVEPFREAGSERDPAKD